MPKVSIVLPTYNGIKYIHETIDSIINQSFSDWELIIVDDCSTDETGLIADNYAQIDSRIRVIHNEHNIKLPGSLNVGFREAKGKYYTWTSDDNIYYADAIEKMSGFLDNNDVPLVRAHMRLIDEGGNYTGEYIEYDEYGHYYNDRIGACFLYRSEVAKEIGEYDTNTFLVEDYDYWLRMMFSFGSIGCIDEPLYDYRYHNESLTSTKSKEIKKQLTKLWEKNIDKLFDIFTDRPEYLCRIYFEYIEANGELINNSEDFLYKIPELKLNHEYCPEMNAVIYGAGITGKKAFDDYGENVVAFSDRDPAKTGTRISGKLVVSPVEIQRLYSDCQIIVAVRTETIYEVLCDIKKWGIDKVCVYQSIINNQ